jgi:hypothetical protein
MSTQWKYQRIRIYAPNNEEVEEQLNAYGKDGWELVSLEYDQDDFYDVTFKMQVA